MNSKQAKSARRHARTPKAETSTPAKPEITTAATTSYEPAAKLAATPKRQSKIVLVMALLNQASGSTLDDLVSATGWLPHTTRAALTGLRKKGHIIDRCKVDGVTHYSIGEG